jgi:hypothetical protein
MKAISIPFNFSNGSVTAITETTKITEQNIIDVLITAPGERAINVGYGANIQSLLYEPLDTLVFDDFKLDTLDKINKVLVSGNVVDITTSYPDSPHMAFSEDSTLSVSIKYSLPFQGSMGFTFNVNTTI